jgi:hypothetical protein
MNTTKRRSRTRWTPEKVKILRRLWEEGQSILQIAAALSIPPSAVGSKKRSLGLGKRLPSSTKTPKGKRQSASEPGLGPEKVPQRAGVSILDIKDGQCRSVLGYFEKLAVFCGRATKGKKSYCPEHCAVYQPQRKQGPPPSGKGFSQRGQGRW